VSLRYFTVYGPKCLENHAIMAMIARSFLKQDPFEVWGDGSQVRNWTFIDDIVAGTISAAEKIDNGITINLGTTERILVKDAVQIITEEFNYKPMIKYLKNMPFRLGVKKTINWYKEHKKKEDVRRKLPRVLIEK